MILLITWGSMGFSQYIKETYCYESRGTCKGVCLIEELYVSAQVSTKTGSSVSSLGLFPTIQSLHPWSSTSWSINPVFRGKNYVDVTHAFSIETLLPISGWNSFLESEIILFSVWKDTDIHTAYTQMYYISVVLKFHGRGAIKAEKQKGFLDWGGGMK